MTKQATGVFAASNSSDRIQLLINRSWLTSSACRLRAICQDLGPYQSVAHAPRRLLAERCLAGYSANAWHTIRIYIHIYIYILYTLGWNEQRKIGRLKSNTNQKLPNGRYSKTVKTFQKYYCLLPSTKSQRLKRYDFFEKNACFTVPIFYTQLLKCQATFHWNVRFKRKRMTYCLSIYVFIW